MLVTAYFNGALSSGSLWATHLKHQLCAWLCYCCYYGCCWRSCSCHVSTPSIYKWLTLGRSPSRVSSPSLVWAHWSSSRFFPGGQNWFKQAYPNKITYEWDRSSSRAEKGVRSRTYLSRVHSGFHTRGEEDTPPPTGKNLWCAHLPR